MMNFDHKIRRIILAGIMLSVCIGLMFSTTGGAGGAVCSATLNNCGDQISFITTVFGNASAVGNAVILSSVTTNSWNANANQTMIVVPEIGETLQTGGLSVSSITDTFGDSFRKLVGFSYNPLTNPEGSNLEVWTGSTKITGTNAVTANWNNTNNELQLQVAIYSGVAGVVQSQIANNGIGGPIPSLTITTIASGSWIVGTILQAVPTTCNTLGPGPSFVERINTCTTDNPRTPNFLTNGAIDDNATSLRNAFALTYAPTSGTPGQQNIAAVVEMSSIDKEPLNPNFATFCTTTNGNCCTSSNGQCVGPVTVQILFIPVVATRSTTAFTVFMYATPIPFTSSVTATFQWLAHNSTFAFTESGGNQCTIAANAFSCSVSTTFGTPFVGTPNVVASSTTPSKTAALP